MGDDRSGTGETRKHMKLKSKKQVAVKGTSMGMGCAKRKQSMNLINPGYAYTPLKGDPSVPLKSTKK